MDELTDKQKKFIVKWKERRKKKYLFILLHVYWGIPLGLIMYFSLGRFKSVDFDIVRFLVAFTVFVASGLYHGLTIYNALDKAYLKVCDKEEVLELRKFSEV